jgi:hypothetical protein
MASNDAWLDERATEIRASNDEIRKLESELQYLQLGWRPPDGGWSIAQVFEHLILTDQPYVAIMSELLKNAKRGGSEYRPTMLGNFIINAVSPEATRKVRARPGFQPAPEPRANVVKDYLAIREEIVRLVERSKGVDLNRSKMKSPVMSLIRYNLGDAIMILARHTQRHLQQINRVRAHPDFPKAS